MSNNFQTNTTSALHNAIMEAGGKNHPSIICNEPYEYQWITTPATPGTDDALPTGESRVKETYATILEEIRKRIDAEVKVVHIILTGIDNDIYSIVDACPNGK
ncbi:hypothetical protein Tco_1398967 [Tanacetum coccineum]